MIGHRGCSYRHGAIFDLDDTLYPRSTYVESAYCAAADYLARSRGVPEAAVLTALRAARGAAAGRELQVVCEQFALPATLVWRLREVMRSHAPALVLPAESRDVLTRLRAEGWRLGILTNGLPAVQRRKVAALGLAPLVDHVIYAEEHSRRGKPDPRPFRAALERLRVAPARSAFVGDDWRADVTGAAAVGMYTIWMRSPDAPAAAARAAHACVSGLQEVTGILLRLQSARAADAA